MVLAIAIAKRKATTTTSTARSINRSWKQSPIRLMRKAFSDKVNDPSILLREVMRNVAQPVAVAVTSVPSTSTLYGKSKYHGATLTSFTSLTLYPFPLVAFSLRLPSRMADCLRPFRTHIDHNHPSSSYTSSSKTTKQNTNIDQIQIPNTIKGITLPPKSELPWPLSKLPMPEQPPEWAKSLFEQIPNPLIDQTTSNPLNPTSSSSSSIPTTENSADTTTIPFNQHPTPLTISLLSKSNESIADSLSLPSNNHSSIFNLPNTWINKNENENHPPSLKNSLGSLKCEIVGSVLLKNLCGSALTSSNTLTNGNGSGSGEGSELFICRVIDVDIPSIISENNDNTLKDHHQPLLHWRRKYVGIKDD
ncbi:uncharacterized protein L201_006219 [Kwoniella dendrophila CBS 6074]|uniref:Flavin reductase like domain-containing protein n=1 Tax=Kwoniella dendrophila CBS 6074 TaxID=1295534 RepID=A0AAX4K0M4_9TREE